MTNHDKLDALRSVLSQMRQVVVAYSGGADSAFLLKVAVDTLGPDHVKAILAISPTYPSREYERALATARMIGVKVDIISTREVDDPRFVNNPVNRCYFCKHELFTRIIDYVRSSGIRNIIDGSNVDDLSDHRPGKKALQENHVRSPLQEVGLTKNDIRVLSRDLGLPTWNKDALACLSSRFPYGENIDLKKLQMVDAAENFLSDLGFGYIRARHEKNSIRIEVSPAQIKMLCEDQIRLKVVAKMKELGYTYVSLDLEGYRQGSMNEPAKLKMAGYP